MSATTFATPTKGKAPALNRNFVYAAIAVGLLLLALALNQLVGKSSFPEWLNFGLRAPLDGFQKWVIAHRTTHPVFLYFFDPLRYTIEFLLRALERLLLATPWSVLLVGLAIVAWRAAGRNVAILSVIGLLVMGAFGLWEESIATLSLMGVSVVIALLIGIPLGIYTARHPRFEAILRPLLDAMQTMPAFVYLIPVVLFFGIARVPSVIATVIYALPPAIRLTALGIRQVSPSALEAAEAFGSTDWQKLIKVQLPLARPSILAGVNQTIMMALGIVVIAAMIGAGGLGKAVLDALRSQKAGAALEAGLAIVLMAVIFDRISEGASQVRRGERPRNPFAEWLPAAPNWLLEYAFWSAVVLTLLILLYPSLGRPELSQFPQELRISIAAPVDRLVAWMRDNLYEIPVGALTLGAGPFSDFIVLHVLNPLRSFLSDWLPWPLVILLVALIAHHANGWRLALATALCTLSLGMLSMWDQSMDTLSQVLVAVVLTVLIGLPLGVWAARRRTVEWVLRPILDFLQTIPPFVYLVPVIMLFNIGRVPGIIASLLYALPPVVRLTTLGIQQVPPSTIEAARAFGSTPNQMLFKVQLPLALPSIMMGINQSVMMVLSMVIIAGLVGGGALGIEAINGLARSQLGQGIEAGLAIVLLAVVLDRITQAWARKNG
ncbi:MAG: ABC transporter permease subunit [Caldilineaceae bacterium]